MCVFPLKEVKYDPATSDVLSIRVQFSLGEIGEGRGANQKLGNPRPDSIICLLRMIEMKGLNFRCWLLLLAPKIVGMPF